MIGKKQSQSNLLLDPLQDANESIVVFFNSIQLCNFVDVPAVLENVVLSQSILEFIGKGIQ
jgi:hypothetical protein